MSYALPLLKISFNGTNGLRRRRAKTASAVMLLLYRRNSSSGKKLDAVDHVPVSDSNVRMAKRAVAPTKPDLQTRQFRSPAAWEKWLAAHHESTGGIWIKFAKKDSGIATVVYKEALDVALCYGWIDGQVKSVDAAFYLQRFTPRRAKSTWSKINCGHVARLIEAGKMQPAGLKQIDAAKADGRWDAAYAGPKNVSAPEDLLAALKASPVAEKFFQTLSSRNRYAILYRIHDAKRAETRMTRIENFVKMLEAGKTLH
jgi:uncharacterized protein YdeI (YjbR/CyaY-like superfamily)